MRKIAIIVLLAALMTACDQGKSFKKATISNDVDSASYSYGLMLAANLENPQTDTLNLDLILAAIHDKETKGELAITEQEARTVLDSFAQKMMKKEVENNKAVAEKFLTENKSKDGVKETASGLQYIVLEEGNGAKPSATDNVRVHYVGTLLNGEEFDSSVKRGQPAEFPLNGVIPGWTEGLQLMTVGSKYKFFIPSDLAYGERGSGGVIGPGETLIFEVELLDILEGNKSK